ncbi:uncharacterized protein LOC117018090 [Rhinolophus ferrumequinum]|uniref:uncharacterized protein LOC117018090 n=1 Tax=Rhinolophus ferrumequinum TaxID=59479 RepID=UPI00140FEF6F|nr:uncharacterized protein LOC117018090 [Rhinolophus ferrumequinum]
MCSEPACNSRRISGFHTLCKESYKDVSGETRMWGRVKGAFAFALNLYPGPRTNSQVSRSGCRRRVRFKGPSPSRWAGRSRRLRPRGLYARSPALRTRVLAPAARSSALRTRVLAPAARSPALRRPPRPALGARIPGPPHHLSAVGALLPGLLLPSPALGASALGSTHTPSRTLLPIPLGPWALPPSAGAGTKPRFRTGPGARGDTAAAGSVSRSWATSRRSRARPRPDFASGLAPPVLPVGSVLKVPGRRLLGGLGP